MFPYRYLALAALLLMFSMPAVSTPTGPELLSLKPRPTILEFGREACHICKRMEVVLERIKKDYGDRLEVRILHVETEEPLYRYYGIVIIPTQVFLDASGKEVFRHEGEFSREQLVRKLKELKFI